jgi:hypothetical protein
MWTTVGNAGNTAVVDWIDYLERKEKMLSAAKLCRELNRSRERIYCYLKRHPGAFGAKKIKGLWFIAPTSENAFRERFE